MTPVAHSFIDIAVLEGVRARMAAGEALVALDIGLERVIWANGPGAALIGFADVESVMGVDSGLSTVARRQIASVPGFPRMPRPATASVRLPGAARGQPLSVVVESLTMPDGEPAVLLVQPVAFAGSRAETELAALAVSGFSEAGYFAALVRADATVAAASDGFDDLDIAPLTIAELVEEVRTEEDRLVKRPIPSGSGMLVAGIARLVDDPACHLLLAAPAEDEEPAMAPEEEPVPAIGEAGHTAETEDSTDPAPNEQPAPEPTARQFAESGEEPAGTQTSSSDPAEDAPEVRQEPELARSAQAAIRFVWRTDAESRFTMVSTEFAEAVGTEASALEGRRFQEVAEDLGIDIEGEISGLLKRRDTWSGRTVMWPIAGGDLRVPVDLAALPIYDRLRRFEGFRGFGVARMAEAVITPRGAGPAEPESPAPSDPDAVEPAGDPFEGEKPAIAVAASPERRQSDKVIRLAEHRPPEPGDEDEDTGLSPSERHAFREIGNRLKLDGNGREIPAEGAVPETAALEEGSGGPSPGPDEIAGDAPRLVAPKEALDGEDASGPEETSTPADDVDDGPPGQPSLADEATAEPDEVPATLEALEPFDAPDEPDIVPSAFVTAAADLVPAHPMTALLGGLPVPLLVHSGERLHFANREFLKLTGYSSIEAIAEAGGLEALFLDGGDPNRAGGQMRLRAADGGAVPVSAHLQSISWADGKALLLVLLPVPSQAREEDGDELLAARLAEMRTIVDTATDGVVLIDNDGTIRSLSRPAEALFGMDSVEVEGQPFGSLFAMESRRSAEDYLSGLADNGVASVLNDGREVIGREAQGRFIPLFMTIGRLPGQSGFCAVLRDITSWKRAEDELNRARTQAEQASSQKTEFLARVSHEVRTPLNAIIGFSELMLDEKFGPIGNDRYRDYLRDINRSGNHVLDLVNDLLDISKIEAGEQEMSYEAVALNEALAETVAMMQPQANRERVIIRSSFASGLPDVVADLRSVRQIALNLLSNAIRHTPAGGQVIVSTAYEASGDIVARVRDTGIGMTLGEIEQALKPFKQVNALKRARGDGTGLGLPLTKAMVEANRARFSISSSPSQGTLVEITFPSTRVLAD